MIDVNNNKIIFVDMDGVLAKWEDDGQDPRSEGFMLSRKPDYSAINLVKELKRAGYEIAILSAVYNTNAELEKIEWLKRYGLGDVAHFFVPYGSNKAEAVNSLTKAKKVLIDDFSKNLRDWEAAGLTAVKYYNGINGTKGSWKNKRSISHEMKTEQQVEVIRCA